MSSQQPQSSLPSSPSYYYSSLKTLGAPLINTIPLPPVEDEGYYHSPNANPQLFPSSSPTPASSYYHSHSPSSTIPPKTPGAPYIKTIPLPPLKDNYYYGYSVNSTPQRLLTPPPTYARTNPKYQQQQQQRQAKSYHVSSRKLNHLSIPITI